MFKVGCMHQQGRRFQHRAWSVSSLKNFRVHEWMSERSGWLSSAIRTWNLLRTVCTATASVHVSVFFKRTGHISLQSFKFKLSESWLNISAVRSYKTQHVIQKKKRACCRRRLTFQELHLEFHETRQVSRGRQKTLCSLIIYWNEWIIEMNIRGIVWSHLNVRLRDVLMRFSKFQIRVQFVRSFIIIYLLFLGD